MTRNTHNYIGHLHFKRMYLACVFAWEKRSQRDLEGQFDVMLSDVLIKKTLGWQFEPAYFCTVGVAVIGFNPF